MNNYCEYCDSDEITTVKVPAVNDDKAWARIASEHNPDCEWVETRAHRRMGIYAPAIFPLNK